MVLSISIFRSLPFLLKRQFRGVPVDAIFQSPFSGASLSYEPAKLATGSFCNDFQSPFSGASLSYALGFVTEDGKPDTFQSPFSGASLSYCICAYSLRMLWLTFNLHFQEPPFLTAPVFCFAAH